MLEHILESINELERFTKKIISMVLGIISTMLFIFINYQANEFSKLYNEIGLLNFMSEVNEFKFFSILITLSIGLIIYALYLAFREIISDSNTVERIISLILFLTLLSVGVLGIVVSIPYLKLYAIMVLMGLALMFLLGSLLSNKN